MTDAFRLGRQLAAPPEVLTRMLPINDLTRHNAPLRSVIQGALDRVLDRGYYILGPENSAFESEFSSYLGTAGSVGVANGTDALELAVRAVAAGPGSEVVTVANAGMYSTTAIRAAGATPRYVDIRADDLLMDTTQLAGHINSATRAVIVTHLYGRMVDVAAVRSVADPLGVAVIEDCAQAHGAVFGGVRAGASGDLAAFSFYPTKNLGALGDGGLVTARSDLDLLETVRRLRQYGWSSKYHVSAAGGRNSRLDEVQAAILRAKLPYLDGWNARRREIAGFYSNRLGALGWGIGPLPTAGDAAHLYVVQVPDRDAVRSALAEAEIATDVHYPVPDHRQAAYPMAGELGLEITDQVSATVLTLPNFPEMTDAEAESVVLACRRAAGSV